MNTDLHNDVHLMVLISKGNYFQSVFGKCIFPFNLMSIKLNPRPGMGALPPAILAN